MKAVADLTRRYFKRGNFRYDVSSNFQSFTVPEGCTSINVECVASKGADVSGSGGNGGNGGKVTCALSVTQGQTLYIMVGAIPSSSATASYNASDIRTNNAGITDTTSLNSRLIVAGGGGSGTSASSDNYAGGAGGGLTGGDGRGNGKGKGGTQTEGGEGGPQANAGSFGLGGSGNIGGAGGAGWYGGGAGSSTSWYYGGGGGGGSSYTSSACSNVAHTQGANNGSGYVNIYYYYEGTATNYDCYIDTGTYKVVKTTEGGSDKYEAFKTLEKGQYYGN